jgi:hypothetical protein
MDGSSRCPFAGGYQRRELKKRLFRMNGGKLNLPFV